MAGRIVGARLPLGLQDYLQHPDFALQAGDHFKISGVKFVGLGFGFRSRGGGAFGRFGLGIGRI
jgi:hypothetical protein